MLEHHSVKSSLDAGNRSSIFLKDNHTKRDLLWRAFRKTVLEPHNVLIHDDSFLDDVPPELLDTIENKAQNVEQYAPQALTFAESVAAGSGFGHCRLFPSDSMPCLSSPSLVTRCAEPIFETGSVPPKMKKDSMALFQIPEPRPCFASGFGSNAFTPEQFIELPQSLLASGTIGSYNGNQTQQVQDICCPFLMFEVVHDNIHHETQAAANYCAMNGATVLHNLQQFFDNNQHGPSNMPDSELVIFTCAINDDSAILYRHWLGQDNSYNMAPLCKFDFRDLEHFMYFLTWIEAIEAWATETLYPRICQTLNNHSQIRNIGVAISVAKALPSPVTTAEKEEKLSQSMRLAFENIPWKGDRPRNTPLGATMRMRNPRNVSEIDARGFKTAMEQDIRPRNDLSIAIHDGIDDTIASPDTVIAISPPPSAPFAVEPRSKSDGMSASKSTPSSPAARIEKKRRGPASFLSIKSATLPETTNVCLSPAPLTEPEPPSSRSVSTVASAQTMPLPDTYSEQSPAMFLNTAADMKSPARSVVSVSSKKSFMSLRSGKSLKSPSTPNSNASPRTGGFKSKLTGGLDAIRERTTPRRTRAPDNTAPNSAKDVPLPTPAYDKKRFEIRPPTVPVPPTPKFWEQALKPASLKSSSTAAYNAGHILPFRQYATSPTVATVTTTLTAGGLH